LTTTAGRDDERPPGPGPVPVERGSHDTKEMPFLEHLEELRRVLIDCLIAVAIGLALAWSFSDRVLELLITRTMPGGMPVVFLGPAEAFSARIKVALACAVLVTAPFIFWRVWRFVVPGLMREERAVILPAVFVSSLLFYAGGGFGLFVLVPAVMRILLGFGTSHMTPAIAVGHLLGFVIQLSLACGLLFELPLVTTILTVTGVVSPEWLRARWRHAVLIIFVIGAAVTPGDGPSALLIAVPVSLLYLMSVALSFVVRGRRRRNAPDGERSIPEGATPRTGERP
jgi:sec-independent protein translocase protein TatC